MLLAEKPAAFKRLRFGNARTKALGISECEGLRMENFIKRALHQVRPETSARPGPWMHGDAPLRKRSTDWNFFFLGIQPNFRIQNFSQQEQ